MDKNSSLLCLKFSLIAGNSAVICLGMAGFLTGLITPNAMAHLGVSGSQLALVSAVSVVVAAAGFIGALREHFCLLLTYALCIIAAFVFRLTWSLAGPLHHTGRFVLDTTASLTLLSSLAKLFLMIFAVMLALAAQNSLPLTKEKFFSLKNKLKLKSNHHHQKANNNNNNKIGKDKIDSVKYQMSKSNQSLKRMPSRPRSLKIPITDNNGIYVSSASNNVYESGRRRSPNRNMMMMMMGNGHHHPHHHGHHHSHNGGSSRSRRYLINNNSGVGYSAPMSPDVSHSSFSQDSNNNNHKQQMQQQQQLAKSMSNPSLVSPGPAPPPLPPERNAATMERQRHHHHQNHHHPHNQQQRGNRNYSSQRDYIHYRSPSPPAAAAPAPAPAPAVETSIKQQSAPKFTNQPFYNYFRSSTLPVTTTTASTTSNKPTMTAATPAEPPTTTTAAAANQRSWSMPRSVLYSPTASVSDRKTGSSSGYTSPLSPKPSTAAYSRPIPASRSGRLFASSPTITTTTASAAVTAKTTTTISSTSVRSSLFATPTTVGYYRSSKTLPNTAASNLSQTRNLFSNFTSPLYAGGTTTETENVRATSPAPTSTTLTSISSMYQRSSATPQRLPVIDYHHQSSRSSPLSGLKSPTPSPNQPNNHQQQPKHFQWSSSASRTPTPPVTIMATTTTTTTTAPKYKPWVSLRPGAITSNTNTTYSHHPSSSIITSSSSSTNLFSLPSNYYSSSSYLSSKTYPRTSTSTSTSIANITTTTTVTSTTSSDKQRYWYSTSTSNIGPSGESLPTIGSGSSSSAANLFARVYPKTYEEYVKSYRYPEQQQQSNNRMQPVNNSNNNPSTGGHNYNRQPTPTGTNSSVVKTITNTTSTGNQPQPSAGLFYYTERTLFQQT